MKRKTVIGIAALLLLVSYAARGQASFWLRNRSTAYGVDAPVFDGNGVPLAGTNYLAELWGGATVDSLAPARDFNGDGSRVTAPFIQPGYFFSSAGFLSILTVPPNGFAWLEVRAWDVRLGATYEEVAGAGMGGYGESPLFYAQGKNPDRDPPEDPALLVGLQSFSLRPIPEPATWALLASGGTMLYCAVRGCRKKRTW